MSRSILFLSTLIALLLPGMAAATDVAVNGSGDELFGNPRLDAFLRVAARDNPGLKASYERWMGAVATISHARGWPDPQLSYVNYLASVETALGPQQHSIALQQRFPWFGKLSLRGDAAEQAALAAEQRFLAGRLALYQHVAMAYYEYAFLGSAIGVTQENLELVKYQEEVVRARYRTDAVSYAEVMRAQVELGVLEDQLRTLDDRRSALAARLNASLGRSQDQPLPWPLSLEGPDYVVPPDGAVFEAVDRANPQLRALDHEIGRADRQVAVARRDGYPDFTFGVQTVLTDESQLTRFDDRGRDAWMASVSLNIPLWRGKYNAAVRAAEASKRSTEFDRVDRGLQLSAAAREALFQLHDSERKIDLYGNSLIPKAQQALQATATSFQNGRASFLDFLDAQRTLLRFELELARARADRGQRVIEIARLVGAEPVGSVSSAGESQ